ncbi:MULTISPECIES: hypothetical protein [Herbaspirillum]|uniref:Uncharacterized protein n=2 Tax=Herbaspirillum huttiense TaxID=863372 RepID=A0AAJ2LS80_9BURK|nr:MULTISPECIES: hypothetical protein [Herbaspirillum]MDR9836869.1 hypothetical protein [Herbaspirillum huttiense]
MTELKYIPIQTGADSVRGSDVADNVAQEIVGGRPDIYVIRQEGEGGYAVVSGAARLTVQLAQIGEAWVVDRSSGEVFLVRRAEDGTIFRAS